MNVPSTGQKIKYRPYLVKEEKVLLQAFESGDPRTCLEAMTDTLSACIDERSNLDVSSLATFDVEYMFVKVRSKSVGENSNLIASCTECSHENPVVVNLDEIEVEVTEKDNVIVITDDISVEMRYPTYDLIAKQDVDKLQSEDLDAAMGVIAASIESILTEEERIDTSDLPSNEIVEFLSSMTANQLKLVADFMENMPALKHNVEFSCENCGHNNSLELKGLADFF